MGPTWVLSAPDGHHVGPMNLAIRVISQIVISVLYAGCWLVIAWCRFNTKPLSKSIYMTGNHISVILKQRKLGNRWSYPHRGFNKRCVTIMTRTTHPQKLITEAAALIHFSLMNSTRNYEACWLEQFNKRLGQVRAGRKQCIDKWWDIKFPNSHQHFSNVLKGCHFLYFNL